jgi:hypothetical protein
VVEHMQRLQQAMVKSVEMAVQTNEFAADTDAEQFAFELFGIISTCYRSRSLFRDKDANIRAKRAFDRLLSGALKQKVADKKISRVVKPKPRAKSSVAK